ncbi:CDP-alcohol phosphatidyltransferase family protein [Rhodococcus sp. BP-252]|uniref:CDP-diacylglycerol--glycerol-3-phosphate 3-phosphatidyltransferase n=1 Tax=Rhodococcoides kyotonense TaxID=398843 RepID=A0A177Y773_9NOCA|nr:CDP-alcohol phosphatidyltransferase family protein [Rhodococcus sp. BP-320]MBY6415134.1 CDP-alcohol phosphatidyltransferase family protein [Rhodococcus sp. BP-321]MBY6421457.1 CDP-alcohol phosphatidyltransferase family protein [Rhodococcus sp. BP-324]MBY6425558.1 CDP-alcohol phosphatidyltransferase family protein [Rhodococcus sp. BP-323]MBY6430030.1 CDP-alcohol phosphatidyltransferase family protein [Rhodococcus sp. BP-322]MBY6438741.1 CDP-alcohol phosphatidyltransferase family protein [Rho
MVSPSETDRGDRILTVPNVLSVLRLLLIPLFLYLLLVRHADGLALAVLLASGATDWLDGKLARALDQSSRLGELLDPLVDRLSVVTALVAFVVRGIIPWWVAALLIGRDLVLAGTMFVYRRRGLPPPQVIYLGKAATFVIMMALPVLLIAAGDSTVADVCSPIGYALLVWGTALYTWTGILYTYQAILVGMTTPTAESRPTPHA